MMDEAGLLSQFWPPLSVPYRYVPLRIRAVFSGLMVRMDKKVNGSGMVGPVLMLD